MAVVASLDSFALRAVATGGVVREDIMDKIWDVSRIPLPFTDRVGRGTVSAAFYDWVVDRLATPDTANAWVEEAFFSQSTASAPTDYADSATAPTIKYRNYVQVSVKGVSVSEFGNSVTSVGGSGGLAYNLTVAQQELRRDVEAMALGNFSSVVGNATTTAPRTAGYVAMCQELSSPTRDLVNSSSTYTAYNSGTGIFAALGIAGTKRAMTEAFLRDMAQALYVGGCGGPGQNLTLMTSPTLKRVISTYMYTSTARIASLVKDVASSEMATAQGAVDIFITDFGTLELVPNRFQTPLTTGADIRDYAMMFDPSYFELVYLRGYQTTENAKIGLMDRRTCNVYWGTRANPECIGVIADIDTDQAMTA
jgi:hypothetical protein